MSFNFLNVNSKSKWINEYKNIKQYVKNEELNLLKFFLVNNYHLNKVYKKYVYKEICMSNLFYENNMKKIHLHLNNLLKLKKNNIHNNNNNKIIKAEKMIKNIISTQKEELNKKYELLKIEENEIEKELKDFNEDIMEEYDKGIEDWKMEISFNNTNNISIIVDNINNKEYFSDSLTIEDKNKEIIINQKNINNFRIENNKINNQIQVKNQNICLNKFVKENKNICNLMGNLNIKKNNENIIRLTTSQIPKKYIEIFDNFEDPLQEYLDSIINEIDNTNDSYDCNSNINNISSKKINSLNSNKNIKLKNKTIMENNINFFLNKTIEENKNINYFTTKIKYINRIIKEKMGGNYLGWGEIEHKEFIFLKNVYKDQSNSYRILADLNNIFPSMNICELKRHIKLYEIYLKIDRIKKLLIEKNKQMKDYLDIDKSRISKQTSTSVTKSTSSYKVKKYSTPNRKFKISSELEGKKFKSVFSKTRTNFFDSNNIRNYKNNEYMKTNYNRKSLNVNGFRKHKGKIEGFKNHSSMTLNNSKNKSLNSSCNIYKRGKIKNFFNKNNKKK